MFNLPNDNLLNKYKQETAKMSKVIDLLEKLVKRVENASREENPSEITNKLNLLQELVWMEEMQRFDETREIVRDYASSGDNLLAETEVEVELPGEEYEQLVLPGCGPEEKTVYREKKKVTSPMFRRERTYLKASARRHWAEVLQELDQKWLSDFHKYLCTDTKKKGGKRLLAEKLAEWVCEYPLQLLLTLDESSVRLLRKISEQKEGEKLVINEKNLDDYLLLANLGAIDLRVTEEKNQFYFGISVPEEIRERLLSAWKEIRWENLEHDSLSVYFSRDTKKKAYSVKELLKELELFFDKVLLIADFYGFVETEEFRRIFEEVYQIDIPLREFMRFVYLEGTFHQALMTGNNRMTGESFIGMRGLDANEVILKREKYCRDIGYPTVTEDEMEEALWGTDVIWRTICGILEGREAESAEISEIFEIAGNMVTNGSSVAEVMEYLLECYEIENPVKRGILWRLLVLVSLCTPLPMLKGYSRDTFYDTYGKYRYLDMFRETCKKVRRASLYELPVGIQEKLAELAIMSEEDSYFDIVSGEEKLPKECMQNEEIKLFLFVNRMAPYQKIQDPVLKEREKQRLRDMATRLCEECRDSETTDLILKTCNNHGIVNYMSGDRSLRMGRFAAEDEWEEDVWDDDYAALEPVIKPAKIYPNDPCPCGSGKKYKKCCGRKAETK